jgi:oxygen-dependent protoporphyrinogen oxidase
MIDLVIVGGGIAGLAAAWEAQRRGVRPLVLEAAPRPGGVIVTEHVRGFVIDGGPDSILVQKPAAVELCRELGIADRLVATQPPRTAYVLRNRSLVPLPEASFLGFPTRLGSLARSRLFPLPARLHLALEIFRPSHQPAGDESIGAFVRRRFGDEAVRYLAEPLLAGIHAGDVEQLSVQALFPKLAEAERTHGSVLRALLAMRRPTTATGAFVSFRSGLADLVTTLAARLGPELVRCDAAVRAVEGRGPYVVTLDSGEQIAARATIVTVPAWRAAQLLTTVDLELVALCARIPYASSVTVVFAFRRDQVGHPLNGTGFVVPRVERQALLAGTWISSKWPHRAPEGHVLMRGFLGGATDPAVLERSDEELVRVAHGELAAILNIAGDPALTRVFRWPQATPQYLVGHLEHVRQIDQRLSTLPGLSVTGSGYRGTGIPDVVADARLTAAAAVAFLTRSPHRQRRVSDSPAATG